MPVFAGHAQRLLRVAAPPGIGPRPRDRHLRVRVRASHDASRRAYGRPRIWKDLVEEGERVSEKRVGRLMREEGVVARPRRRFKATTMSEHDQPVAANVLDRQFTADRPNQRWVGDTTEFSSAAAASCMSRPSSIDTAGPRGPADGGHGMGPRYDDRDGEAWRRRVRVGEARERQQLVAGDHQRKPERAALRHVARGEGDEGVGWGAHRASISPPWLARRDTKHIAWNGGRLDSDHSAPRRSEIGAQ